MKTVGRRDLTLFRREWGTRRAAPAFEFRQTDCDLEEREVR